MDSLLFRSWKDFSLGWWNALASAWFPGVRHFENLTLWIQLRLGLRNRAWKPTNGHSHKLEQLSRTIFSKFLSQDHYPICIHGCRSRCLTCITEQVTSEVVDMFSRGGRPLDCNFANTSVEMAKFVCSTIQLRRQCFINPWIQTTLFLIITVGATLAAVIWQFAGWISPIPPWLYSTTASKVCCLQCGQIF